MWSHHYVKSPVLNPCLILIGVPYNYILPLLIMILNFSGSAKVGLNDLPSKSSFDGHHYRRHPLTLSLYDFEKYSFFLVGLILYWLSFLFNPQCTGTEYLRRIPFTNNRSLSSPSDSFIGVRSRDLFTNYFLTCRKPLTLIHHRSPLCDKSRFRSFPSWNIL